MTDDPALIDLAARESIENDTGVTLFVEAGAGSGKTKSLIDRVRTLVLNDGVPMTTIAAVTFTEKAGAELRDRLRTEFEGAWRSRDPDRAELAERALADLDSAAIGTLHSFAQRILSTHPIEAGLPPLIEVLDEVGSSVAFDDRWSVLQRELLDDADLAPALLRAMEAGVTLRDLRSLMRAFGSDWDLVEDRVIADTTSTPTPTLRRLPPRRRGWACAMSNAATPATSSSATWPQSARGVRPCTASPTTPRRSPSCTTGASSRSDGAGRQLGRPRRAQECLPGPGHADRER